MIIIVGGADGATAAAAVAEAIDAGSDEIISFVCFEPHPLVPSPFSISARDTGN